VLAICLKVEDDLDRIRNAQSQQELMTSFKDFGRSLGELNDRAGRRQMVLFIIFIINSNFYDEIFIAALLGHMTYILLQSMIP